MNEKIKKHIIQTIRLLRNISKDNVNGYSAECAYYTILSFIPFLIILITLIQYTGLNPTLLFNAIATIVPKNMNSVVIKIVEEVYSKSVGTISLSILVTIWSAGKGLYALIRGLHDVYDIHDRRSKSTDLRLRIRAIIGIVLFVVTITLGLTLLVFSEALVNTIKAKFNIYEIIDIFTEFTRKLFWKTLLYVISVIVFIFIYKFLPKHRIKVTFKSQFKGAIIGALVLNVVSLVFSIYLDIFKKFSITYGSLTILMLVMMWTYSCFYAVFLGAEINKLIKKYEIK